MKKQFLTKSILLSLIIIFTFLIIDISYAQENKCGDNVCDEFEQSNPGVCYQDCEGFKLIDGEDIKKENELSDIEKKCDSSQKSTTERNMCYRTEAASAQNFSFCQKITSEDSRTSCIQDVVWSIENLNVNICSSLTDRDDKSDCCRFIKNDLKIKLSDSISENNELKEYINVCNDDSTKKSRGIEIIKDVSKNGNAFSDKCEEITDSKNTIKYFGFNKKYKEACFISVSTVWNVKNSFIFYYFIAIGLTCVIIIGWRKKIKPIYFNPSIKGFLRGLMISLIMFLLVFAPIIFVADLYYLLDKAVDIAQVVSFFLLPFSFPFISLMSIDIPLMGRHFSEGYYKLAISFSIIVTILSVVLSLVKNKSRILFWVLLSIFIFLYIGGLFLLMAGFASL